MSSEYCSQGNEELCHTCSISTYIYSEILEARIYIESYILNIVKNDEIFHYVTAQLERENNTFSSHDLFTDLEEGCVCVEL